MEASPAFPSLEPVRNREGSQTDGDKIYIYISALLLTKPRLEKVSEPSGLANISAQN